MKIINVTFTTRLGGLEQVFLDYNAALQSKGHDVISILHPKSPIVPTVIGLLYKIANFSKYDLISLFKLKRIVQETKPDIIITHGNRAYYLMKKVASNVSVIGVSHNYSFDFIKNCDYIISVSKDMMKSIINQGYPSNRIFHIPNQIQIPENYKYTSPKFREPPVIGVIARFERVKGIDVFIEALNVLNELKIAFKVKIAGDGIEYDNIKGLITKFNLTTQVELLGWINDKKSFYDSIDILCVPSRVESFGLIILEGLLHSKPVVVSDLPGPMEIVKDNIDALIFQAGDFTKLANCLALLLLKKDLAETLAKNGFEKVKSYDIKQLGNLLNNILASCCS
jgi:glycosyltransferase involved in cell wall biosynthesis